MLPGGWVCGGGGGIERDNSPQLCPMTAERYALGQRCAGPAVAPNGAASGLLAACGENHVPCLAATARRRTACVTIIIYQRDCKLQ